MTLHPAAVSLVVLLGAQVPPPVLSTGRIEGEVIDAQSRSPIVGARVSAGLLREMPHGVTVHAHPEDAITDANGRFALAGMARGRYQIVVEKLGYAWPPDGSEVQRLDVTSGRTITGVQISLKKTGHVAGRIVHPQADCETTILVGALKFMADRAVEIATARANADGVFRFDSLSEGKYLFVATARRSATILRSVLESRAVFAPTYYPGTTDRESAQVVFVTSGQTVSGVQFSLLSAPAFEVAGVVVNAAGNPVGGAVVTLIPASGPSLARVTTRARPDGTFHISDLMPGRYQIAAGARAIRIEEGSGEFRFAPLTDARSQPVQPRDLTVENSDVTGMTILLGARK